VDGQAQRKRGGRGMIMQAQVQALQDEVKFLIAKLDESEARVDRLEALLVKIKAGNFARSTLEWDATQNDWVSISDIIAAALKDKP
jgi:hypothetical protein